jgi:hypothetical protein
MIRFLAALSLAVALTGCGGAEPVDRLTFVNDSEFPANVSVRGAEEEGWTQLGTVEPSSERAVELVIDQGDEWIFMFEYAGEASSEVELARSQLESSDWRVTVPEEFAAQLLEQGVDPPGDVT